jgi:GTP-binding protein EngB required for normal cell division
MALATNGGQDAPDLNENHRRSLSVLVRHVAKLLDEIDRLLFAARRPSPFNRLVSDVSPAQAGVIRDYVDKVRRTLLAAAERHRLDVAGSPLDVRHAIDVQATMASIAVEDSRPSRLRGYGALDPSVAEDVDRTCDEVDRALREMQTFVRGGPDEDFAERLSRLGRTAAEPDLLSTVERVLREHGLVEFRPGFAALLARLEEKTFHVAVFGRVSSGKSSLLNALLGAPILPVGVTPVTAVPARVRLGIPALARIRDVEGRTIEIPLERLPEFASEEGNPGNVKRVARLEVVYPVPGLPEGIELVDTPGIGSLATSGSEEAFAYLPRTDLALLLVDAAASIGPDELGLLRVFKDAAIPVEILLSKADLVDEASRRKLVDYVRTNVAREVGLDVAVAPVSAVASERTLVKEWFERRLRPLFARRKEVTEESARRMAGRLLEGVIAALSVRAGVGRAGADAAAAAEERRRADARIAETRARVVSDAEALEGRWADVLIAAVEDSARRWESDEQGSQDARAAIASASDAVSSDIRRRIVASLHELHDALAASASAVGPAAADLFHGASAAPDLSRLPVADVVSPLPSRFLKRPMLFSLFPTWSAQAALNGLRAEYEKALREVLRVWGFRLRDWAERSVESLARAYHGAVEPFVHEARAGSVPAGAPTAAKALADLGALERLRDQPVTLAGIPERGART